MKNLTIDTVQVRRTLVDFIRKQIATAGLSHAVVNLSGGLDSAVTCALTAEALGSENVLALRLPYRTSSPESLAHAQLMIDQLGVRSFTFPISDVVDQLISLQPNMSTVRKGNLMARVRMIIGFDQSAAFSGLVVGTGNKTEILLGYTTLYGDSACAFNPVGNLYKTQMRQLAGSIGIPDLIISKAPSADLWFGQTDEGELGFTYENVDRLLFLLVDHHMAPADCTNEGFEEKFIHQVLERIHRNNFKRILPPIASLSETTVGLGYVNPPMFESQ